MNRVLLIAVVLIGFWRGNGVGQDIVLPQPLKYCWPITIPIYDTAFHLNTLALKNNKIKFFCIYDEDNNLLSQTFVNRQGLTYLEFDNDNKGDVEREYQMFYDSFGQITLEKRIEYDPNKHIDFLPRLVLDEWLTQYENRNGIPWKMYMHKDTNEYSTYGEAVYENGILTAAKRVRVNNPHKFSTCKVGRIGDTLTMCGTDRSTRMLQLITKIDTVILSGIDMWPNYTIVKDKKLIYTGNKSSYTKYYYKENGLVDFTVSKSESPEKEKTYYYRYYYYED